MYDRFKSNINSILNNTLPKSIAVAVSGGCDSMALTILASKWAAENNINMTAITVDHNIRSESKDEAEAVHSYLKKLNINHETLTYTGPVPKSNIEQIARNYRYELIFNYMKKYNIDYLFIAHNMDEQAETFLLNLTRGSGISGLSAMDTKTKRNNITIIRPMMIFKKSEIKEFLCQNDIKWVEDPSNQDEKYKRVKIRKLHSVFENLGLTTTRIISTIDNIKRVNEVVEFYTTECIKRAVKKQNDKIIIDINILLSYPVEISLRTLASVMKNEKETDYPPRFKSIKSLLQKIKDGSIKTGLTLHYFKIYKSDDNFLIFENETGRN